MAQPPPNSWAQRMEDGGFSIISSRRGGGGGKRTPRRQTPPVAAQNYAATAATTSSALSTSFRYQQRQQQQQPEQQSRTPADTQLRKRIESTMAEVRSSDFYKGLVRKLKSLPAFSSIVCLGVGNFGSNYAARCQFALTLLLRDELLATATVTAAVEALDVTDGSTAAERAGDNPPPQQREQQQSAPSCSLHVFDPVLDELELRCVRHLGGMIRPKNEEGRISLPDRCLYIALHCPRQLYSNLLDANWGAPKLANVAILGNSFGALADANVGWCRVTRVGELVREVTCAVLAGASGGGAGADLADFDHAFASSSLHYFQGQELLPPPEDEIWTRPFDASPQATGEMGLMPETYLSMPPVAPPRKGGGGQGGQGGTATGATSAAGGEGGVASSSRGGWLADDSTLGWLCVSFPNVGLAERLQALSSAALLAQDTRRRLAVVWRRGDSACADAIEDLFVPSALLLPRAPRHCESSIVIGAADARGSYAQQRRARVACWELCEGSDWYVQQQETDAGKAEARQRQTAWLSKLTPTGKLAARIKEWPPPDILSCIRVTEEEEGM